MNENRPTPATPAQVDSAEQIFLGLRTAIYPAPNLDAAKALMSALLGIDPYFDTDFYVGYSVSGYELALDPNASPNSGVVTFWGVADADVAFALLLARGATPDAPVQEVGDNIRTATFSLPDIGGTFGIIENPHFEQPLSSAPPEGPGR